MRFQNHRHRSFVLTVYDLLTRRRPTLGYLTLSGCCQSWILIIFFPRFHRPECSGHLVGQRVATTLRGLRSSMACSHVPWIVPLRVAQRMTDIAPMMSSRRISRCPIFDVRPKTCLPPVKCCRGTRPSQAAKSRLRLKTDRVGAKASIAIAVIGPRPGIVIIRDEVSERAASCFSVAPILAMRLDKSLICSR